MVAPVCRSRRRREDACASDTVDHHSHCLLEPDNPKTLAKVSTCFVQSLGTGFRRWLARRHSNLSSPPPLIPTAIWMALQRSDEFHLPLHSHSIQKKNKNKIKKKKNLKILNNSRGNNRIIHNHIKNHSRNQIGRKSGEKGRGGICGEKGGICGESVFHIHYLCITIIFPQQAHHANPSPFILSPRARAYASGSAELRARQ